MKKKILVCVNLTEFIFTLTYIQQMERFRIVEKETKTKAYSKEGIIFFNDDIDCIFERTFPKNGQTCPLRYRFFLLQVLIETFHTLFFHTLSFDS